jgi:release factor glutamine methyltransferase
LFAGPDGLDLIRRLTAVLAGIPLVALEVGAGQATRVAGLLGNAGFQSIEVFADLGGHDRVVLGRR